MTDKTQEVLKKIQRIEVLTRRLVDNIFAGEYQSTFRGQGMEFDEVREYQPGDEIRAIDWNVTARIGQPFVKTFVEERELVMMLLVDVSKSNDFGTRQQIKAEIVAEIAALMAFSAIKNNDKVGLINFTDQIEIFVPPRKGKKHVLRLIHHILQAKPNGKATDISLALEYLSRVQKRRSVVFLISDFQDKEYETWLQVINQKHDLIAIVVTDPAELFLPNVGLIELEDAETNSTLLLDTGNTKTRNAYKELGQKKSEERQLLLNSNKIDQIEIRTDQSYIFPLLHFFQNRR
tara:strand:- start:22 stop:894 length:873 start_codon:yes stop_codon:yes gene_type:complete